uniref:Caspase-8 n=1 Tax=Pelodiscus sinensis TaxID=13735 RepID=K7FHJ8_PELSI
VSCLRMDFHRLLFNISEALTTEDLVALKFLSLEYIPLRKQENIQDSEALFLALEERGMMEKDDLSFLKELLFRINRIDVLTDKLHSSREEMERELQIPGRAKVSPFRYLLFQLSENITTDELKSWKFLLKKELPKCKMDNEITMIDVLIEMEKKGLLAEENLKTLKTICEKIDKSLLKKIEEYELVQSDWYEVISVYLILSNGHPRTAYPPRSKWDILTNSTPPLPPSLHYSPSFSWDPSKTQVEKSLSPQQIVWPSSLTGLGLSLAQMVRRESMKQQTGQWGDSHAQTVGCFPKQTDMYKMNSQPRGICLILNNHDFSKQMKDRNGTNADAAALTKVFTKLHFEIKEHRDLTAADIRHITHMYRNKDHRAHDCFVCCILSHGDKGIVFGTDGQEIPIQELTTSFTGTNCPSLAGKPKVFFIQACQGDTFQRGIHIETDSTETDYSVEADARFQLECIPNEADFLLGMATMKDFVSYRSTTQGTWYIQSLCEHLEKSCPRGEDILSILTAVNQEVSRKNDRLNQGKQMPQPSFTLRKKLIFPI